MHGYLANVLFVTGLCEFGVLIASALVPIRLQWKKHFETLPKLHRQMYWVYGGYVVMAIVAISMITVFNASELASGGRLARGFCAYVAVFWGVRLMLQWVLDVKEHLKTWWLWAGYRMLTVLFACFTLVYTWVAIGAPLAT